jgi:2-polyprenyl-3-methyl-5-hydroxy-6-metoxy-1,4-benzoquinol methylase
MDDHADPVLLGRRSRPDYADFSSEVAYDDHKIRFVVKHARGRDVLDIGCVQHNPENYRSKYWVHRALAGVSKSLLGIDLFGEGVRFLQELGYNVRPADAQAFQLDQRFDVIVAGDIIEHLEDFGVFVDYCKAHLRPGGRLLISTPNPWYWRNVAKAALIGEVNTNPEHTCWLCPRTLRQLLARHGLGIAAVEFGSRYWRDRLMPLPRGIKHTSFHAEVRVLSE